jgi:DNA-binding transcriptional ArsR family regulator
MFRTKPLGGQAGGLSVNHSNIERGIRHRRTLLSIARTAHKRGLLMPSYTSLGRAVGLSQAQVSRHMGRLFDEEALRVSLVGRRRGPVHQANSTSRRASLRISRIMAAT